MKHLTWFCIRHGLLPSYPRLRKKMLRSIFRPADSRDAGIDGWYDLGSDVSPEDVSRFRAWVNHG